MKKGASPSGVRSALSFQAAWPQPVEVWRKQLAQCARKPSRRRVHALRSLTLRLRQVLEFRLQKTELEPAAARAFNRWKKEVKKLRRMLQPVRDADVYLDRLASLCRVSGQPPPGSRCQRELNKLEKRLQRRRQAGADELQAAMQARGRRLLRLSREMEAALTPCLQKQPASTAPAALRMFAGMMEEFPRLDSANLHNYRKRLKPILYLAEFSAAQEPAARRLAVAFRKMHLAVGEWHDWQSLTLEAARCLPGGRRDGLLALLEETTAESLQRALRCCRRSAARLKESVAARPPARIPRKPLNP